MSAPVPVLLYNGRFYNGWSCVQSTKFFKWMYLLNGKIRDYGCESGNPEVATAENNPFCSRPQLVVAPNTVKIDLGDKMVLPAFIDGHMHTLLLGQSLRKLDLDGSKDLDEIRARIKKFAAENPDAKRLCCRGWMHSMTNLEAKASMIDDLDPRPIFIDSKDLHSTWCNTAALEEMGVQDTPDPVGGMIERDENGKASGLLNEAANFTIAWPHLARVASMEEKIAALKAAFKAYNAAGYTGAIDMAMDENGWEALQELKKREGRLTVRIAAHWLVPPNGEMEDRLAFVDRAVALKKQFNLGTSPDLRIVGIKVIMDGVIDGCTAALLEPYSNNGIDAECLWTQEMLDPVVAYASQKYLQVALHAIGDAAVHIALNAIERGCKRNGRHRIEHLELTSPGDATRLAKLGITASIQPVHADPVILRAWPKLLGKDRLRRAFAYSEIRDAKTVLAIGSDSPTAPYDPLKNMYVATTRKSARDPASNEEPVNEHFKITLSEAINSATHWAAYSCFADDLTGRFDKGLSADFVVVDMEYQAEELLNARVLSTWFAGECVFQADL